MLLLRCFENCPLERKTYSMCEKKDGKEDENKEASIV